MTFAHILLEILAGPQPDALGGVPGSVLAGAQCHIPQTQHGVAGDPQMAAPGGGEGTGACAVPVEGPALSVETQDSPGLWGPDFGAAERGFCFLF